MTIDTKTVARIAELARIQMEPSELDHYAKELSNIMGWIEQLQEVNTDNVPPLASVSAMELPWRKDVVTDGNAREKVLANAPDSDYGCFVVPKVVET